MRPKRLLGSHWESVRSLYISTTPPGPRNTHSSGLQQRGDLLVDALASLGELEVLVYTSARRTGDPAATERILHDRWDGVRRVHLFAQRPEPGSRWHWHVEPLLAPRSHVWVGTNGRAQVAHLESVVARGFDLLLAHGIGAMQPILLSRAPRPPVYFDMNDVPHRIFLRRMSSRSPLGRLSACLRLPGILWAERRMASLARRTFVCSELDRRHLSSRWGLPRIGVVPNAVRIPLRSPLPAEPSLLFIGILDYRPNAEAAELLATRIWPLVRREVPQATLRIAGRSPARVPSQRNPPPGLEFTGYVPDLGGLYRSTRVVCAPIRVGAGTRVKLVEAAAHGRPIVATPLAAEGLGLRHGIEILLAEDPSELAAYCIRLLRDPSECQRLGDAARRVAEQRFSRERAVEELRATLASDLGVDA